MRNFKVTIRFDGSRYGGWQRQKNSYAVQQAVEETLKKILNAPHTVTGCSRTDAGVHANRFVFNFFTENTIPVEGLKKALHCVLPDDIAVLDVQEASLKFSARFSAVAKEYIYCFYDSPAKNPFLARYALHHDYPLRVEEMAKAASYYVGCHDFAAFRATGSPPCCTERNIFESEVKREGELVVFRVLGDGFLYNMVRIMAGTLLYVSMGKLDADSIPDIIQSKQRDRAGKTLPPVGLYLNNVYFEGEEGTDGFDTAYRQIIKARRAAMDPDFD